MPVLEKIRLADSVVAQDLPAGENTRQAKALAIGSTELAGRLAHLFEHSKWTLEWTDEPKSAVNKLARAPLPAVLCDGDWAQIAAGTSALSRPPVVIALDYHPSDAHWMKAVANGVIYVDARHLRPQELFPLLNHAWRVWNTK